jgi:hypothetical protein
MILIEHHIKQLIFEVNNSFCLKQLFYGYLGAKVLYYDDQRHGPSLELTWSNKFNDPKHYHVN